MEPAAIFVLVVILLVALAVFAGIKTVPQGSHWTIERFGRYRATLHPGLNLIVPFVDRVGRRLNMQENVLSIPSQTVITRDNATVTVDGVVFYQVLVAERAAYEVGDLNLAIVNLTLTNIRTAIGALDLDETLSKRDEINDRLLHVLDAATQPWGTKITRVELKDVSPPANVVTAMAMQLTADREKRARILEAEGVKQAQILRAEGEKQSTILAAEGRLESARRDAEARERLAQAEAAATEAVSRAVGAGSTQALNYFVAQKYLDALRALAASPNARLVMLPIEATGVLGALAGIAELARDVAGGTAKPPPGGGAAPGGQKPWAG